MSELYLILHKVRGEPAFDVAENIGDETGDMWIIPTSGHRAYPHSIWLLTDLRNQKFNDNRPIVVPHSDDEYWISLPDHYQVTKEPPFKLNVRQLLAGLRPTTNFKRRV